MVDVCVLYVVLKNAYTWAFALLNLTDVGNPKAMKRGSEWQDSHVFLLTYCPGGSGESRSATCKSFVVLDSNRLIIIKSDCKIKQISVENIIHVTCESTVCDVFFKDGTKFCCSKPLRYFEELLEPYRFARISHNTLVNIAEISEISFGGRRIHKAVMSNKESFTISQRRWKSFKERIGDVAVNGEKSSHTSEKSSLTK